MSKVFKLTLFLGLGFYMGMLLAEDQGNPQNPAHPMIGAAPILPPSPEELKKRQDAEQKAKDAAGNTQDTSTKTPGDSTKPSPAPAGAAPSGTSSSNQNSSQSSGQNTGQAASGSSSQTQGNQDYIRGY